MKCMPPATQKELNIEDFLIHWLNGEEYPHTEEILEGLYEKYKHAYSYSGTLYRGIEMELHEYMAGELKTDYLASFSDEKEVAKYFAGKSDQYGHSGRDNTIKLLIKVDVQNAFALDLFLSAVQRKTVNEDLQIVIEERIWENEKIHLFSLKDSEIIQL